MLTFNIFIIIFNTKNDINLVGTGTLLKIFSFHFFALFLFFRRFKSFFLLFFRLIFFVFFFLFNQFCISSFPLTFFFIFRFFFFTWKLFFKQLCHCPEEDCKFHYVGKFHINIYIYIYCHPQRDCFVVSQLFSVARHIGRLKLGSKPAQLYVRHITISIYLYI